MRSKDEIKKTRDIYVELNKLMDDYYKDSVQLLDWVLGKDFSGEDDK